MTSPPQGSRRPGEAPPLHPLRSLTDDLLADILIRLPTLADLGRASVACAPFRRVVADHSFRRRLRALHRPVLLGFLTFAGGFLPAEPPHRSAPAARALAGAADFGYSFLPSPRGWVVRDARDGRVLLDRNDGGLGIFTKLAVCDPLFRRYVVLPPIPEDMAASVQQPHLLDLDRRFEVFLAPSSEDEAPAAQTSFRVIWMAQCPANLVAFVFSSVDGQWHPIAAPTWHDLNPAKSSVIRRVLFCRSYAYGCFYWMMTISASLLVLDMAKMEFSLLKLPSDHTRQQSAIVEAGEGKLGMFALSGTFGESRGLDLFSIIRPSEGAGANEWRPASGAILPHQYRYHILGEANGKVLVQGDLEFVDDDFLPPNVEVLSIDFNTLDYESVCGMIDNDLHPLPLLGYPPSLSSPSI
ncbi:hypothetical protein ACP70R_004520 [Stipagrostis hirtigluma subsp. patula]